MWKGPEIDGITQSLLGRFLECPYSFYLYAILGLEDQEAQEQSKLNLVWGDVFHKGLELYIPQKNYEVAREGMIDYLYEQYPGSPESFQYSTALMLKLYRTKPFEGDWVTEEVIDDYITIDGKRIRIRGKRDAITRNHPEYGSVLGEHKAKGFIDPAKLREEIEVDTQCNVYMLLEPECEWVFYDLIKIPEVQKYAPKRAHHETPEEYTRRIFVGDNVGSYGGHYPIYQNRGAWVHQGIYHISKEAQEEFLDLTLKPVILRMCEWFDYVTQSNFDHTDPKFFNEIFYRHPVRHFSARLTNNYKCNYHGYLTNQVELDSYIKNDSLFSELEEDE